MIAADGASPAGSDSDDGPLESVRFSGLRAGTKLIVLGAVHGNEICGPNAIRRVIDEIRAGAIKILRGEVTFVPVANPKAYRQKTREGDRNLNRDMRDKPLPQNYEDRIGNRLCAMLREHEVLLDIHSFTGEGEPFIFFGPRDNDGELEPFRHEMAEAGFAACLGAPLLIHGWLDNYARRITECERLDLPRLSITEGYGTTEYMRFAGGYGVTLECGQHDDPAAADVGYAAILKALARLGMVDAPKPPRTAKTVIEIIDVILCEREGDKLEGNWKTGDAIKSGQVFARRATGDAVSAPRDGFLIFPSTRAKPGEGISYFGVKSDRPLGR